jgi:hypothetical protein
MQNAISGGGMSGDQSRYIIVEKVKLEQRWRDTQAKTLSEASQD